MTDIPLSSIPGISHGYQLALKKNGFLTASDVLLTPVFEISQQCRLAPQAVQEIVSAVARALNRPPRLLRDIVRDGSQVITTGDTALDQILGGGIRVGMVWEFVGEGASGKTQLALQLSLLVQLPVAQGGLDGSACYLTTSAGLPTPRLVELLHEHPLLADSHCNLDNIQTSATKTVTSLLHVLSEVLPASIDTAKARSKPLKLLIIDSLADLLLEDTKTSTTTLSERSRNLSAIAVQLHALAATHQLAVVALNRVTDVWERRSDDPGRPGELLYDHQARIFGRASDRGTKSAALGLVWANQVNARIMLARTERRHVVPAAASHHDRKRLRVENARGESGAVRADDIVVRRLTVVFSSVCAPASIDFLVTSRGVQTLADGDDDVEENIRVALRVPETAARAPPVNVALAEVSPLDVGSVVNDFRAPQPGDVPTGELGDDDDIYWRKVDELSFVGDNVDLAQGTDLL